MAAPHPVATYTAALVEIKREFREHYALMALLNPVTKPKGATLLVNQQASHEKGKSKFKKQYKMIADYVARKVTNQQIAGVTPKMHTKDLLPRKMQH